MIARLFTHARGQSTVEFALIAPTFLMFMFLLLDGGRMMFTKQALNELAAATARCAAISCPLGSFASYSDWSAARGKARSALALTTSMVTVTKYTTATAGQCGGVANMAQATIVLPYNRSALGMFAQSGLANSLSATSCFPIAS